MDALRKLAAGRADLLAGSSNKDQHLNNTDKTALPGIRRGQHYCNFADITISQNAEELG